MKNRFLFAFFVLNIIVIQSKAAPPDEGKNIFMARCAACHNVNKTIVGPALGGIDQRRSFDWIVNFVHSSQSVVKSGDAYAIALFEKFNKVPMPDHPDLTQDNIKNIVAYIKSQSMAGTGNKAPFAKPSVQRPYYLPLSIHNYAFFIGFLLVVLMLIVALLFAVQSNSFRRKMRGN